MKVIKGYGAPTTETIGYVNDFYVDLNTNDAYRCTNIKTIGEERDGVTLYASGLDNTVYTWEKLGGSDMRPIAYIKDLTINGTYVYSDEEMTVKLTKDELKEFFHKGGIVCCMGSVSYVYHEYVLHAYGEEGDYSFCHIVSTASNSAGHKVCSAEWVAPPV